MSSSSKTNLLFSEVSIWDYCQVCLWTKCEPTLIIIFYQQVWHYGLCRSILFGGRRGPIWTKLWSCGEYELVMSPDWNWTSKQKCAMVASCQPQGGCTLNTHTIPCCIHLTLNRTIIHQMNIMLFRKRLETSDWGHKLPRKLFTEVINQLRSRLIFSEAYI